MSYFSKKILGYRRFYIQFIESVKINGLAYTLREILYYKRELLILEKDLSSISLSKDYFKKNNIKGIEITNDNFNNLRLKYPFKNRYLKTLANLQNGYKAFAILRNTVVIGDMWYSNSKCSKQNSIHPDIKWLGIDLKEKDVYLFDLYVNREERENLVTLALFGLTLQRLKQKGYRKAYSFIFADNTPSITFALFLKFKEFQKLKASRFLFYKKADKVLN